VIPNARAATQTNLGPCLDPSINKAKTHKLFLYFPTTADDSFPDFPNPGGNGVVSPAAKFDPNSFDIQHGSPQLLTDQIKQVVTDDYCEFNVQVFATTDNPDQGQMPPPIRTTVAIGSDTSVRCQNGNCSYPEYGVSCTIPGVDKMPPTACSNGVNYARVWAGEYTQFEGYVGGVGKSTGALAGANSDIARWAEAIGGSAAHEAGHTYGLQHTDDDPTSLNDPSMCGMNDAMDPREGPTTFHQHLMPAGCYLTPDDRAAHRFFSDQDYGVLASRVGLSVATMHVWTFINPNKEQAVSLTIDFLSQANSISVSWPSNNGGNPWINPTLIGPNGTTTFAGDGQSYNVYRLTWSQPNPDWKFGSGMVDGGEQFSLGTSFFEGDVNQPHPEIITDVSLYDAAGKMLALHPRIAGYDGGAVDWPFRQFVINFFAPLDAPQLQLAGAKIFQLPRLADIESLIGEGAPFTRDERPIVPWSSSQCGSAPIGGGLSCVITSLDQPPHVQQVFRFGQPNVHLCGLPTEPFPNVQVQPAPPPSTSALPAANNDAGPPDLEGGICAGADYDPYPSAVVYLIATFVDPNAQHYDPASRAYVVGPVASKLYYQFAGVRNLPVPGRLPIAAPDP
jgi:hypothetical protein